jgi:NAD(P)-dependent dehydrogenase (short-subunit alcohol dehydrogenase family)
MSQPKHTNKLKGQRVVIIGRSSGLGFGLAEAVIEEGGNVVVTGSRDETVKKTVGRLREGYPSAAQTGED